MYDIIGDIHGHASVLEKLLNRLGYSKQKGTYRHPERKVVFVGDYIDRGPEIPETLRLVRGMVQAGQAIALMGNHEYNAILFNEPDGAGGYLRPHTKRKVEQHENTLKQFDGNREEYHSFIDWFKTLPLYLETENFRAVHASWHPPSLERLSSLATQGVLHEEVNWANPDLDLIAEELLKGKEAKLPGGTTFEDKDGTERDKVRVKWWLDPSQVTMDRWSMNKVEALGEKAAVPGQYHSDFWYDRQQKLVFFGHYWRAGTPKPQATNVCCLDYSIAKEGKLVAYRYEGEDELLESRLEWVEYG